MPQEYSPRDIQKQVQVGYDRMKNFRSARLMFLRNYVGQYYDRTAGNIGTEPLNLIFNAIRVLVPHIVMSFPKHRVSSPWLAYKDYAQLLGLAIENHDKEIDVKSVYRRMIVDAIFTLGTLKTGLASSGSVYALDDNTHIDQGSIYTANVDFDNLVCDPKSTEHLFVDANYIGDRQCVPRAKLLESGRCKNDLVERLPSIDQTHDADRAKELSMRNVRSDEVYDVEDYVEVIELWVPGANAVCLIPGDSECLLEDYLAVSDYYGPKSGPYTFLALTPPVPGNPLPVPSVGIWNDLHMLSNRMAHKIVEQAERQKDIVAYRRKSADDAQELRDAKDGEAVAVDDPEDVQVKSFGGQQNSNEVHLAQLQQWFNMLSANPQQMGGQQVSANTATGTSILQANAGVGLEDMKDLVYTAAQNEAQRRAWYLHTDPLINMPLTRRTPQPAQFSQGMNGPVMTQPPQMQEEQVILTPEARRGDFMDFAFKIEPESMGRMDSQRRFSQALDFCTKIMPAVMTAAQAASMLGIPFSAPAMMLRMATDAGIDWMEEVLYDPNFQQQMMMQTSMGPQPGPSKGQPGGMPTGPASPAALMQNGQPADQPYNPSPDTQFRQQQQSGANDSQAFIKNMGY